MKKSPNEYDEISCIESSIWVATTTHDLGEYLGEYLGLSCIESSIWVATTTGLPAASHSATISFCHVATRSSGTYE